MSSQPLSGNLTLPCPPDDVDLAKRLVKQGADVNAGMFGHTPLHMACTYGFSKIVEFLATEGGADVNFRDVVGETPFWHACKDGQLSCAKALASVEGVDLVMPASNGNTPKMIAQQRGHAETVAWLEALHKAGLTKGGEAAAAV